MRELVTTILDALGLLLLAAGLAAAVVPWLGWSALAVAGVVVLTGSGLSARLVQRPREREALE